MFFHSEPIHVFKRIKGEGSHSFSCQSSLLARSNEIARWKQLSAQTHHIPSSLCLTISVSPFILQNEDTEQQIIRETFHLVSKRDENVCNFLEGGMLIGGSDYKLIYRHYATLYFVFCVDSSESELGILDLIQVFVETLDKCFENVCELDLIFHVDKVHNILAEMVMGGMVLETNMNEIITQVDAQNKMEKSEAGIAGAPARAVSAVKNMNLPEMPRNINIGDISIKVPNLPSFK